MRILASPARRNRARNPYNFLLSDALAEQACDVVDLDGQNGVFGKWDVFHIHWPQHATRGRKRLALRKTAALLALLLVQRMKGTRIVWTVHNVRSHDQHNAAIERVLMWLVVRLVHGVIYLSPASRAAACAELPALERKRFTVIPHGLYGGVSAKTRDEARVAFGLPSDRPVVGFLGDIKRYKGLDLVLDALGETSPGEATLFIGGAFQHAASPAGREYTASVRARIADLQRRGYSIVFRDERLDDDAFADGIRACDLVALPYRAVWNSGFALLVLENRGRLFASDAPAFRELQQELGPEWVHLVEGSPTGSALRAALGNAPGAADDRIEAFRAARAWPQIAAATLAFYRRLGAGRRHAATIGMQRAPEG
jgi:glycosyltransferase involved in cell wall biosynthesis